MACWVTPRFDPLRPEVGGSASGVVGAKLITMCDEYIFIGNEHVHRHRPILGLVHETMHPSWLYSRALNGSGEFIAIWRR